MNFKFVFNTIPSYFWIIYKYFTSFFILGRNHIQWFYKGKKMNPMLKQILIQFEFDLYDVISNFAVNFAHNLIGSFLRRLLFLVCLLLL